MDIAISAGLEVGVQALRTLNKWLDEEEIAITWYGKDKYQVFTGRRRWPPFPLQKLGHLQIQKVFRIKKEAWQKVIENCLSDCYTWNQQVKKSSHGECCWLLIYRSLPNETKKDCLQKPQKSLSSIGIITSLPAARVDSWGLVVLGLANGAKIEVVSPPDGVYNFSRLDAQNFVLTIWKTNIAGPMTAHIEPKEHPADSQGLTSPEWNNLLWYGHSFGQHDHIYGWPLVGEEPHEPPEELLSSIRNEELSRLVIDDLRVTRLRCQLREAIHRCNEQWDTFKTLDPDSDWLNEITHIQRNLCGLKLILVDEEDPDATPYLREQRREDTLHYAEEQFQFVQRKANERRPDLLLANPDEISCWGWIKRLYRGEYLQGKISNIEDNTKKRASLIEYKPPFSRGNSVELYDYLDNNLLPSHKFIVALTRLLTKPKRINAFLSTRDAGIYALLA